MHVDFTITAWPYYVNFRTLNNLNILKAQHRGSWDMSRHLLFDRPLSELLRCADTFRVVFLRPFGIFIIVESDLAFSAETRPKMFNQSYFGMDGCGRG